MIPEYLIEEWRVNAPWQNIAMVEQDLIISRALVELYNQPTLKTTLAFRGGTALNKLYIKPPRRYSEDIDLVQIKSAPIGTALKEIRSALDDWLGKPRRKLTERSVKLIYRYNGIRDIPSKLKIEINTTEHLHVHPLQTIKYSVDSSWFKGKTNILTYELDELMGTKLKALYQRRKGRDLFDLWYVLDKNLIDLTQVVDIFNHYCHHNKEPVTRAMFEESLFKKEQNPDFLSDMSALFPAEETWDPKKALKLVREIIMPKLKGAAWKGKNPSANIIVNTLLSTELSGKI